MNTSHNALLVILACLLLPLMEKNSSAETQNPVVDDAALAEQFVKGLATLVENALSKHNKHLNRDMLSVCWPKRRALHSTPELRA